MPKYLNQTGISLPLAVLLATDFYDHDDAPDTISTTALIKPLKQTILSSRVTGSLSSDISSNIASTTGTALHELMEKAWLTNYAPAMLALGYDPKLVDRVCINPTKEGIEAFQEQFKTIPIPIYLERRTKKDIAGWTVSGAFDFVAEARVYDLKSTSTYSYVHGSNEDAYIKQMSIYRWLNQDIITQDSGSILYWFKDWSAIKASSDTAYPPKQILEYRLDLLSIPATEAYIEKKLNLLTALKDEPESSMPECTEAELWASKSVWKYYKNKNSTGRSTKNFDNPFDAATRLAKDNHVGKVIERKSEVKACKWCAALSICDQAKKLVSLGRLVV